MSKRKDAKAPRARNELHGRFLYAVHCFCFDSESEVNFRHRWPTSREDAADVIAIFVRKFPEVAKDLRSKPRNPLSPHAVEKRLRRMRTGQEMRSSYAYATSDGRFDGNQVVTEGPTATIVWAFLQLYKAWGPGVHRSRFEGFLVQGLHRPEEVIKSKISRLLDMGYLEPYQDEENRLSLGDRGDFELTYLDLLCPDADKKAIRRLLGDHDDDPGAGKAQA